MIFVLNIWGKHAKGNRSVKHDPRIHTALDTKSRSEKLKHFAMFSDTRIETTLDMLAQSEIGFDEAFQRIVRENLRLQNGEFGKD